MITWKKAAKNWFGEAARKKQKAKALARKFPRPPREVELKMIDDWIAKHGVTLCPPMWATVVGHDD